MYQTINESDFIQAFDDFDRSENFTRAARRALFDWYTDLEDGSGESMELEVIGICCDWAEHDAQTLFSEYGDKVNVCRYVVDLDERGEFRASIYSVDPATGEDRNCIADVEGSMFEESGELEGIERDDAEAIIHALIEQTVDVVLEASDDCEVFADFIDELRDDTMVIEVSHFNAPDTYLVLAH